MRRKWTNARDARLKELFPTHTNEELVKILGVPDRTIRRDLRELGLSNKKITCPNTVKKARNGSNRGECKLSRGHAGYCTNDTFSCCGRPVINKSIKYGGNCSKCSVQ